MWWNNLIFSVGWLVWARGFYSRSRAGGYKQVYQRKTSFFKCCSITFTLSSLLNIAQGDIKILYCWFHLRLSFKLGFVISSLISHRTNWFERYRDSGMKKLEKGNHAVHRYYRYFSLWYLVLICIQCVSLIAIWRYCTALVLVTALDVYEVYTTVAIY